MQSGKKTKILLFSLLSLDLVLLGVGIHYSNAFSSPKPRWALLYYMSYDNDLSKHGNAILQALSKGLQDESIVVAVQVDFTKNNGMQRIVFSVKKGKVHKQVIQLKSEDSADERSVASFLSWIQKKLPADNYMLAFLNHGGKLNQMCSDVRPFSKSVISPKASQTSEKWLRSHKVGQIVARFHKRTQKRLRLLFLQQCGRSTLQNLYHFAYAADYTLASPLSILAPNTYYTKTLQQLRRSPNWTGKELAQQIMRSDKDYQIYTLIHNATLQKLPNVWLPLLQKYLTKKRLKWPTEVPVTFRTEPGTKAERFVDAKHFFKGLAQQNGIAQKETQRFINWLELELIVQRSHVPKAKKLLPLCSGISLFIPLQKEQVGRYPHLPIYQKLPLQRFFKKFYP